MRKVNKTHFENNAPPGAQFMNFCFLPLIAPEFVIIDFKSQKSNDIKIEVGEKISIKNCEDHKKYDLISCIRQSQNEQMKIRKGRFLYNRIHFPFLLNIQP